MLKPRTQEEYINELAIKNPTVKVIGIYVNNRTPILHYCKVHHIYWNATPSNVLKGRGCKMCGNEKIGNRLRKSREQYIDELAISNPTIKLVGEYIDAKTPTEHYCEIHQIISKIVPYNALHGAGCKMCHIEKISNQRRKSQEEYVAELKIKNPTVKLVGTYINANTPVEHYCELHKVTWNISPSAALCGHGCQQCKDERIGNALRKSTEEYLQELAVTNPKIILCGEYVNANTPTLHKCLIHNYEWEITPGNVLAGHGCPICCESIGEKCVSKWLIQNKIIFIQQYRFDDCRNHKPLPFDFYIPEFNICIEYQGEQHYRPVNFGGISDEEAYNDFLITQKHDKIKSEYCMKNNIQLICIPYWEDVVEYLNKKLLI